MVRIFTALSATLIAALAASAAITPGWVSNKPDNGLYVSWPYKGTVWYAGEHVSYQWLLDEPDSHKHDHLKIVLTNKYRTYSVTDEVFAQRRRGECGNLGYKNKFCAEYHWKVPEDIVPGHYQAVVIVNEDPNVTKETRYFEVRA